MAKAKADGLRRKEQRAIELTGLPGQPTSRPAGPPPTPPPPGPGPGRPKEKRPSLQRAASSLRKLMVGAREKSTRYLYDYNKIEMTFLFCSSVVLISGVMFRSGCYEAGTREHAGLTWFVLAIISASTVLFVSVFLSELWSSFRYWHKVRKARKKAAAKQKAKQKARQKEEMQRLQQVRAPPPRLAPRRALALCACCLPSRGSWRRSTRMRSRAPPRRLAARRSSSAGGCRRRPTAPRRRTARRARGSR